MVVGLGKRILHEQHRRSLSVGQLMHKRTVGAVFQQTPYQVSQQIAKTSNRRVNAHLRIRSLLADSSVQAGSHAMQALKLKRTMSIKVLGQLRYAGNAQRVVRRKLTMDRRGGG